MTTRRRVILRRLNGIGVYWKIGGNITIRRLMRQMRLTPHNETAISVIPIYADYWKTLILLLTASQKVELMTEETERPFVEGRNYTP